VNNPQPWFCPACQKHHGPHVDTCPGVVDAIPVPGVNRPIEPVVVPPIWPSPKERYAFYPPPMWGLPTSTCVVTCPCDQSTAVVN